jgi:hypothetical protein
MPRRRVPSAPQALERGVALGGRDRRRIEHERVEVTNGQVSLRESTTWLIVGGFIFLVGGALSFHCRRWLWLHSPTIGLLSLIKGVLALKGWPTTHITRQRVAPRRWI